MKNETDHFRKRVRKGLGSSHTSTRCVMFSVFVILNVLLNSRGRQAGFLASQTETPCPVSRTSGSSPVHQKNLMIFAIVIAALANGAVPAIVLPLRE